jgi:hypothetical protein
MPNLAPIPSGTDPKQVTAMINNNFRTLNNEQVTKLYNDSTGTPNILIGLDSTGNSRIKVAQPGYDVTTATDAQLAFNSAQNALKIVQSGSLSLTQASVANPGAGLFGNASGTLGTVTHNLGYIPVVMAFIEFSSGLRAALPYNSYSVSTGSNVSWLTVQPIVNLTTFQVRYQFMVYGGSWSTFTPPVTVKYYLLQETAD